MFTRENIAMQRWWFYQIDNASTASSAFFTYPVRKTNIR
jgi:hypothetical protein